MIRGNKVFTVRDQGEGELLNFGIEFPSGIIMSLGFGKGHHSGDTTCEVCVLDLDGKPITGKYIETDDLTKSYVSLDEVVKLINTLNK